MSDSANKEITVPKRNEFCFLRSIVHINNPYTRILFRNCRCLYSKMRNETVHILWDTGGRTQLQRYYFQTNEFKKNIYELGASPLHSSEDCVMPARVSLYYLFLSHLHTPSSQCLYIFFPFFISFNFHFSVFCNFSYRKSLFRNEFENSKAAGILERDKKKKGEEWSYCIKRRA